MWIRTTMIPLAFGALALSASGCGGSKKCTPGVFTLTAELDGTAANADTIKVFSYAPPFSMSYSNPGDSDLFVAAIDFGAAYPGDQLVTLHVQALGNGGTTLLGEGALDVHMPKTCGNGLTTVYPESLYTGDDGGDGDGGVSQF